MQLQSLVDQALGRALGRAASPPPSGLRQPPRLSGGLPVIGHTAEFLTKPLEMLRRAHEEQGEVAQIQVGNKNIVALFGPEGHEAVFRAPDQLLNPQEAYRFITPIFGKGLVYDATIETMGEQLKMLLPALKDRRMRTYGEAIVAEVEQAIAGWGDEGVFDVVEFCRVLTNFTSSRCLLGAEFREGMSEEFAEIYHDLERGITPIAYLNPYLPLPAFYRRDKARVRLVKLVTKIVEARRREGREGEDFLQTLMESRYADGRPLTDDEITGMLIAAMFAGHHTSSVTTSWALVELLRNWTYLERVVAQVDRVLPGGTQVSMQTLRELTLTEYAVKETLRLHPPLFMLIRVAQEDWRYRDYFVPQGSWVVVSPTVSHKSRRYFAHPDRFDPDRFSPRRVEEMDDWSFIPFGGGRHKCLGNAFAILQVKTILGILLGRYEFELAGDPIEDDFQSMVIGLKEPCRLRYKRRQRPTRTEPVIEVRAEEATRPTKVSTKAPKAETCPFHTETPATQPTPAAQAPTPQPTPATQPAPAQPTDAAAAATKRLRLSLDRDLCQGHAVCVGEAPEVFEIAEDGKVQLKTDLPDPSLNDKVLAAEQYCPTHTILVAEE